MVYTISNNKALEVTYTNNGELAAHACCIANRGSSQLEIIDLFATQDYGNMGFEDMLLEEVLGYAYEHNLASVVVTIGPEPFNPKPYLSEAQCIA